jgi:predicted Rossmann fold flavoprotein
VSDTRDVAVVGGGAAGLAAAIFTRRLNLTRSGVSTPSVVVLEGAKKPGAKILVSGGSRCNVTNVSVTERDFWGGRSTIVRRILRAFPVADAIAFFRQLGVALHEEADGKLFPDTNRARDVLHALLAETGATGATLLSDHRVADVQRDDDGFRLVTNHGNFTARNVVLATGGQSLPKSGSDGLGYALAERLGHTIVMTTPALTPLLLPDDRPPHRTLAGVAQDVELTVWIDGAVSIRLTGALLWTHLGVSGPVALNASRHWLRAAAEGRVASLTVNFHPGQTFETVDADLVTAAGDSLKMSLQTRLAMTMPASVAAALLAGLNVDGRVALAHLSRDDRRRVARALVEWPLLVTGTRGYTYAEATAGGVALTEIDPATMESRVCPGLFLIGEILDVDGRIGGFNFQWAWSSAFVAGRALASAHGRPLTTPAKPPYARR